MSLSDPSCGSLDPAAAGVVDTVPVCDAEDPSRRENLQRCGSGLGTGIKTRKQPDARRVVLKRNVTPLLDQRARSANHNATAIRELICACRQIDLQQVAIARIQIGRAHV